MNQEEIFGATLEVLQVDNLNEALKIQNSSHYGNYASIFIQNGKIAEMLLDT